MLRQWQAWSWALIGCLALGMGHRSLGDEFHDPNAFPEQGIANFGNELGDFGSDSTWDPNESAVQLATYPHHWPGNRAYYRTYRVPVYTYYPRTYQRSIQVYYGSPGFYGQRVYYGGLNPYPVYRPTYYGGCGIY